MPFRKESTSSCSPRKFAWPAAEELYNARRASAQLTPPPEACDTVQFGCTVTFDREDGRRQTFRIVGEDEADPAKGSVSWVSPVAQALLGKSEGDTAMVAGGEVEIVAIGH